MFSTFWLSLLHVLYSRDLFFSLYFKYMVLLVLLYDTFNFLFYSVIKMTMRLFEKWEGENTVRSLKV